MSKAPSDDKKDDAWRSAALRLGEQLAPTGPNGYYAMTPAQWLEWCENALPSAELPRSAVFNAYVEFFEAWRALNALPWFKDGRNNAEREAASNRLDDAYTGIVEATDGRVIPSVVPSASAALNARRYEWLRSHDKCEYPAMHGFAQVLIFQPTGELMTDQYKRLSGAALDEAIDTAMNAMNAMNATDSRAQDGQPIMMNTASTCTKDRK